MTIGINSLCWTGALELSNLVWEPVTARPYPSLG